MSTKSSLSVALLLSLSLLACGKADRSAPGDAPGPEPAGPALAGAAADPCAGADLEPGDGRSAEYAPLVAAAVDGKVGPEDVEILRFLRLGDWSAVFAAIPIADPGWFVCQTVEGSARSKDVWAGLAGADDRPGLVAWATALGAPEPFASCFAQTVVSPPAAPAAAGPYAFDVEVALSDAARKRLGDSGESVVVAAMYYAAAKAGAPAGVLNDVGMVDIGNARVELEGQGRAAFDGSAVLGERLEFTEGEPQVNVNVYSGRRSSADNLLDCGFFQDTLAVATAAPVRIACDLIDPAP
ncbi:MAG: hypothetical protein KIS72_05725 [Luteimonas sp.]|nr:hypothetical protein [Luteimonas sp.]